MPFLLTAACGLVGIESVSHGLDQDTDSDHPTDESQMTDPGNPSDISLPSDSNAPTDAEPSGDSESDTGTPSEPRGSTDSVSEPASDTGSLSDPVTDTVADTETRTSSPPDTELPPDTETLPDTEPLPDTGTETREHPTITSITADAADGIYGLNADITIIVGFSEPVTLSGGSLDITLDTGAVVSMTDFGPASSASATFTVGTGDVSGRLDSTAVSLAGGTLRNGEGADVIVALPATIIATDSAITVDGVVPEVTDFTLTSGSPAESHVIAFTLDGADIGTGITHWLVNDSAVKPAAGDPGWVAVAPGDYIASQGYGTKTVYAWTKDGARNVSDATGRSRVDVRLEYSGAFEWTFEKNFSGLDYPKGAGVDFDDNLYTVGIKTNATADWYIVKLFPDGTEDTANWDKEIDWYGGEDSAQGVATDSNGNVYVAGWIEDATDVKWGIKKYSGDGSEAWSREWNNTPGDDGAQAIAVGPDDCVYVSGYTTNASGDYDWWMKKLHPDGSEDTANWNFGFDSGYGDDTSLGVAVDSSSNVYIVGRATSSGGDVDWMIRKYDADGALQWMREYDHEGKEDRAHVVVVDSDNNLYVSGYVTQADGDIDWCVKKYGSDGTEDTARWNKIISHGADDISWGVGVDSAGNVYPGGRLFYADYEWTVVQFNPSGDETFRDVMANTGNDWCRAIVVDSMDYIYGVGVVDRTDSGADWYVKKYAM